jgi:hypothetical protein
MGKHEHEDVPYIFNDHCEKFYSDKSTKFMTC